jgi:hypothetical protein
VLRGNLEPFELHEILEKAVPEWLKDLVLFDLVASRSEVIQEDTEYGSQNYCEAIGNASGGN